MSRNLHNDDDGHEKQLLFETISKLYRLLFILYFVCVDFSINICLHNDFMVIAENTVNPTVELSRNKCFDDGPDKRLEVEMDGKLLLLTVVLLTFHHFYIVHLNN